MKDNSTGKEKDFFSKGKQAFDSIKVIHIDGKKAPQRPWQGLTDEEIKHLYPYGRSVWGKETYEAIEKALREKNDH